ncbi:MAG: hypothetical protein M1319_03925 [Chloroflexi bacterium]|nr:hypothetical protein [Chloroflexota bacterium]
MTTCKDCGNYKPDPTNPDTGYCLGHEVPGDMDSSLCYLRAYTPRYVPETSVFQATAKDPD